MNSSSSSVPSVSESAAPPPQGSKDAGQQDTAKRKVASAFSDIKSSASEAASRLKGELSGVAQNTRQSTAERIHGYSSAAHDAARSLEQEDPNIAHFTHAAADRIESVASYVRNADWGELRQDAESLARRHPVAFLGGLFIAGLVVGNLLKARPAASDSQDFGSSEDDANDFSSQGSFRDPDLPSQDAPYANDGPSETQSNFGATASGSPAGGSGAGIAP